MPWFFQQSALNVYHIFCCTHTMTLYYSHSCSLVHFIAFICSLNFVYHRSNLRRSARSKRHMLPCEIHKVVSNRTKVSVSCIAIDFDYNQHSCGELDARERKVLYRYAQYSIIIIMSHFLFSCYVLR